MEKQSKLSESLIKIIIFYAVVSWLLGEWNPMYWFNKDRQPDISISELATMTDADVRTHKNDLCAWMQRESKRNPGMIIEAQAESCRDRGDLLP